MLGISDEASTESKDFIEAFFVNEQTGRRLKSRAKEILKHGYARGFTYAQLIYVLAILLLAYFSS